MLLCFDRFSLLGYSQSVVPPTMIFCLTLDERERKSYRKITKKKIVHTMSRDAQRIGGEEKIIEKWDTAKSKRRLLKFGKRILPKFIKKSIIAKLEVFLAFSSCFKMKANFLISRIMCCKIKIFSQPFRDFWLSLPHRTHMQLTSLLLLSTSNSRTFITYHDLWSVLRLYFDWQLL